MRVERQRCIAGEADRIERVDEADAVQVRAGASGFIEHDAAHEVVGDDVHPEFLAHARFGPAAQHVHVHRVLEVPQVHLRLPAALIELRHLVARILPGIQQRREHLDSARAVAALTDAEADQAQRDRRRQRGEIFFCTLRR